MFRNQYGELKIRNIVLVSVAVVCLLVGVVLLLIDPIKNMKRQAVTDDMMKSIENASQATFIVKSSGNEVNGEEFEYYYGEEEYGEQADYKTIVAELPDEVVLTALGTIKIPSVDIDIPLWDDATIVSLRYGAGRLKKTADPGQEGNMVILGHRMRAEGNLFHALGEMKIGDDIIITCMDGTVYTYRVDTIHEMVAPEDLEKYVDIDDGEGKQVTLVTCTPLGVATHRLLIIGHLVE